MFAEAATTEEIIAGHVKFKPDVTLVAPWMMGGGMEALKAILSEQTDAKVLVLTTSDLEEDIYRALSAGACGCVLKTTASENVSETILSVHLETGGSPR